jgi:hypothetical protein
MAHGAHDACAEPIGDDMITDEQWETFAARVPDSVRTVYRDCQSLRVYHGVLLDKRPVDETPKSPFAVSGLVSHVDLSNHGYKLKADLSTGEIRQVSVDPVQDRYVPDDVALRMELSYEKAPRIKRIDPQDCSFKVDGKWLTFAEVMALPAERL